MLSLDSLDLFLFSLSRAFCTPIPVFVQIQEQREKKKINDSMRNGNRFAFLCYDINELEHSNLVNLPRVTIIMPLKEFGEHNLRNWRSQITSLYGGPLEFLFVVESKGDPAYNAVSRLLSEFEDSVDAKVLVADFSTTCSQKIHNQLVGTENMHTASMYCFWTMMLGYILDQLEHSLVRWKKP